MDSILPFCTFTTCLVNFSFPISLWLKVHLWSSGSLCELQKNIPQRHSMPNSLSFLEQVAHRSLFTFSMIASSFCGALSILYSSFTSVLSLFSLSGVTGSLVIVSSLGVGAVPCLDDKNVTFGSTGSTCGRWLRCRRRTGTGCTWLNFAGFP